MMTEAELLAEVLYLITELGLRYHHDYDSTKSAESGFPDLVIAGKGGVMFRELKTESGTLSSAQVRWKYTLLSSGADWSIWRPSDLAGRIGRELDGLL